MGLRMSLPSANAALFIDIRVLVKATIASRWLVVKVLEIAQWPRDVKLSTCSLAGHVGNISIICPVPTNKSNQFNSIQSKIDKIPERDKSPKQTGLLGLQRPKRLRQTWSRSSSSDQPCRRDSSSWAISIVTLHSAGNVFGRRRDPPSWAEPAWTLSSSESKTIF